MCAIAIRIRSSYLQWVLGVISDYGNVFGIEGLCLVWVVVTRSFTLLMRGLIGICNLRARVPVA